MSKRKNKKSVVQEFKDFISRGKVLDLAVGVIIGSAFTAIVTSLNKDIIMPFIGACLGGKDFKGLRIPLWNAEPVVDSAGALTYDDYGQVLYSSAIYYGRFLQAIIDFLLVAIIIFTIVKVINTLRQQAERAAEKLKKHDEPEVVAEPAPVVIPEDIKLLTEIRDLLQEQKIKD